MSGSLSLIKKCNHLSPTQETNHGLLKNSNTCSKGRMRVGNITKCACLLNPTHAQCNKMQQKLLSSAENKRTIFLASGSCCIQRAVHFSIQQGVCEMVVGG